MVNNKLDCKTEKFNCLGLKEPYQDSKGETKAKTEKLALKTKIKTLGRKNETNTKTLRILSRGRLETSYHCREVTSSTMVHQCIQQDFVLSQFIAFFKTQFTFSHFVEFLRRHLSDILFKVAVNQ